MSMPTAPEPSLKVQGGDAVDPKGAFIGLYPHDVAAAFGSTM